MIDKFKKLLKLEFVKFFIVGGISTLIDWGSFFILSIAFGFYYQLSLIISYTFGGLTNYFLNKIFTFHDKSKKIALQFTTFFSLAFFSLFVSMFIMYLLIDILFMHEMLSRMITTSIVFLLNYVMHKYITFNKRIFK
jgi:putative flippase GtrA